MEEVGQMGFGVEGDRLEKWMRRAGGGGVKAADESPWGERRERYEESKDKVGREGREGVGVDEKENRDERRKRDNWMAEVP